MAAIANERIDVRISSESKELIRAAAKLAGFNSISEFMVTLSKIEAKRIIEEDDGVIKSVDDKIIFVNSLLNPPAPNDALKSALANYNNLLNINTRDALESFRKKS